MPLDTSIIRSGRAPQIMAPGEIAMRGMSLRALARQGELEKKKLANYEEDRAGELRRQSLLEQKYEQDLRRSIKEMDDAEVADVARKSQGMDALMATSNDPTSWRSNIDAAAQQGLINPAEHQMMVATPFDPNTLEAMQRRTKGLAGIAAEEAKERADRLAQQNLTLRTAELLEGREERKAQAAATAAYRDAQLKKPGAYMERYWQRREEAEARGESYSMEQFMEETRSQGTDPRIIDLRERELNLREQRQKREEEADRSGGRTPAQMVDDARADRGQIISIANAIKGPYSQDPRRDWSIEEVMDDVAGSLGTSMAELESIINQRNAPGGKRQGMPPGWE